MAQLISCDHREGSILQTWLLREKAVLREMGISPGKTKLYKMTDKCTDIEMNVIDISVPSSRGPTCWWWWWNCVALNRKL